MAITTVDGMLSAMVGGSWRSFMKTLPAGTKFPHTFWADPGIPGAGSFAIGDVVNGIVPTSATQGAIQFPTVGTSYLANATYAYDTGGVSTSHHLVLYDRLWHAGSFPMASSGNVAGWVGGTAITRPDATGTDVEAWVETVVVPSVNSTITLTYTDQAGNTGLTASVPITSNNNTVGSVNYFLPTSGSGFRSIQTINNGSNAGSGSFNLVLGRRLVEIGTGPIGTPPYQDADPFLTGLPIIPNGACIAGFFYCGSASSMSLYARLLIAQS